MSLPQSPKPSTDAANFMQVVGGTYCCIRCEAKNFADMAALMQHLNEAHPHWENEPVSTPPAGGASPICVLCGRPRIERGHDRSPAEGPACECSIGYVEPRESAATTAATRNRRVSPSVSEIAEELAQHRLAPRRDGVGAECPCHGWQWITLAGNVAEIEQAFVAHVAERIAGRLATGTGA